MFVHFPNSHFSTPNLVSKFPIQPLRSVLDFRKCKCWKLYETDQSSFYTPLRHPPSHQYIRRNSKQEKKIEILEKNFTRIYRMSFNIILCKDNPSNPQPSFWLIPLFGLLHRQTFFQSQSLFSSAHSLFTLSLLLLFHSIMFHCFNCLRF